MAANSKFSGRHLAPGTRKLTKTLRKVEGVDVTEVQGTREFLIRVKLATRIELEELRSFRQRYSPRTTKGDPKHVSFDNAICYLLDFYKSHRDKEEEGGTAE